MVLQRKFEALCVPAVAWNPGSRPAGYEAIPAVAWNPGSRPAGYEAIPTVYR